MNLILFAPAELAQPLAASDARAVHLRTVLRCRPGDTFDLGVVDGGRGRGRVTAVAADGCIHFSYSLGPPPPPLAPLRLLIGLPRPQTARKILQACTSLGVACMEFVDTGRADGNYARSTLWHSGEWREHLLAGAQQAFCTRLPQVRRGQSLALALPDLPEPALRLAFDHYAAAVPLAAVPLPPSVPEAVVAVGPERGWDDADRAQLTAARFTFVHLGSRVLRTETACVAGMAILMARLGWLNAPHQPDAPHTGERR